MPKSGVTLPTLKKSGISGIKEMRATVGAILTQTSAEYLKEVFMGAGSIFYDELKATMPPRISPERSTAKFPPGAVLRNIFIGPGTPTKPNILVGISKHEGAANVWLWNEFGTIRMKARPIFRNALAATKIEMGQVIAAGILAVIELAADENATSFQV